MAPPILTCPAPTTAPGIATGPGNSEPISVGDNNNTLLQCYTIYNLYTIYILLCYNLSQQIFWSHSAPQSKAWWQEASALGQSECTAESGHLHHPFLAPSSSFSLSLCETTTTESASVSSLYSTLLYSLSFTPSLWPTHSIALLLPSIPSAFSKADFITSV